MQWRFGYSTNRALSVHLWSIIRLLRPRGGLLTVGARAHSGNALIAERLAEAFTIAVKTAAGPSSAAVGPAAAPAITPPPFPSAPISGPSASAIVDSAVTNAIDLIKVGAMALRTDLDLLIERLPSPDLTMFQFAYLNGG